MSRTSGAARPDPKCRGFRRYFEGTREGVTYARVVAQARLEIAQRMLDDPARRVVEVALDLGYSDQAHFGRAFARWTGLAPRQCRRLRSAGFRLDASGIDMASGQHTAARGPV